MDNVQVKTLGQLREADASLPTRLVAAAMSGDAALLAEVQREQAQLPTLLFAAEVQALQAQIVAVRAEIAEVKAAEKQEGAKTMALQEAVREAQRQLDVQRRASGLAKNATESAREELRRLEVQLEDVVTRQAYAADVLANAPVMHSLWHARPPAR